MERGEKQKYYSVSVLQNAVREAAFTPNSKSGPTKLLRWKLHSASQHEATLTFNCASISALSQFIPCMH